MIVLSRQPSEAVCVGEHLTVVVEAIEADRVLFRFEYAAGKPVAESQFAVKNGAAVALPDGIVMSVLDIRGDKVRIGFQTPNGMAIHRKESGEAPARPAGAAPLHRTTVVLQEDQTLRLGEKLTAKPTDIDETGVRLLVHGELLGGHQDGEWVNEAKEVAPNSMLTLGALISLSLVGTEKGRAMFHVIAPAHVKVSVE